MAKILDEHSSVICQEILEEKTSRYRRNVIALSSLALILWIIPGADLADVRAFGVGLGADASSRKFWGSILLVGALSYNAAMFAVYAYRDGSIWLQQMRKLPFSEMKLYFAN